MNTDDQGSRMDLTIPVHRDPPRTQSIPYQTPVSIPFRHTQHSPAYMRANTHATSPLDAGPGQLIQSFSPSHSLNSHLYHSNVQSLPSFPSVPTIPQSVSENWHTNTVPNFSPPSHNFATQNVFQNRPLPSAPVPSSNVFISESYTPLDSPTFLPINFVRSPVSVPSAFVRLPSRVGSRMDHHHIIDRTPSRIMHQPRPHRLVDLDHISTSAQLLPETQSAPAIMSEFPQEHHHCFHNHSNIPWVPPPPNAPAGHSFPMYYTPYPVYQNFQPPPTSPRPMTPRFKIEYSSIHAMFLATIKDADSLKDRKSWVEWNKGVWQAVADGFVLGHICDEPSPGTPWTEWNTPLIRPTVSSQPT
ncbi:uncharacterized protein C8R40DRAFT_1178935 [Lentinula edodes]|uniref:uncharacterized protein n=1 Tax=Lentinula edodes TaxID=5353 RepID=UPI001E8CB3A4|nr:uncharacterized protein C8R40DRAFT_1178935 [Lentinula edodes]KAH7867624.1 hypothetical protein C8R40DRAFT_1178935 [Lentinula edodes]